MRVETDGVCGSDAVIGWRIPRIGAFGNVGPNYPAPPTLNG